MQYFVLIAECERAGDFIKVNDFAFFEVKPNLKIFELNGEINSRYIQIIIAGEQAKQFQGFKHNFNWSYSEQLYYVSDSVFYAVRIFEANSIDDVLCMNSEHARYFASKVFEHLN